MNDQAGVCCNCIHYLGMNKDCSKDHFVKNNLQGIHCEDSYNSFKDKPI